MKEPYCVGKGPVNTAYISERSRAQDLSRHLAEVQADLTEAQVVSELRESGREFVCV